MGIPKLFLYIFAVALISKFVARIEYENLHKKEIEMGRGQFPPEILAKYPHMLPNEVPIWERFLREHGKEFTSFDYDVHLGEGIEPPPDVPPEIARAAKILTQKRVDVVGYKDDEIWIIEVKPYAGISALGQLVGYISMYREQFKPKERLIGAVVCEGIDPDIAKLMRRRGYKIFEYPPPE